MRVYSLEIETEDGLHAVATDVGHATTWQLVGIYSTKDDAKWAYLAYIKDQYNAIDWDVKEWDV